MKVILDIPEDAYNEIMSGKNPVISMFDPICEIRKSMLLSEFMRRIKDDIDEEREFAYADFDEYKAQCLGVDADELPDDDFRYGMVRCVEIMNKHLREVK